MVTSMKWSMRFVALFLVAVVLLAVHGLMPRLSTGAAALIFFSLWLVLSFAVTLVISSFFVGRAPGRTPFGQRMADRVAKQKPTAAQPVERCKVIGCKGTCTPGYPFCADHTLSEYRKREGL